jgi:ornithine decarboxylase
MRYKDMFTVLVVDSRIKRSRSLNDAFERILGNLRDVYHLRTDLIGTTEDAIIRLRNDAWIACVLLEWGRKGAGIDGKRVVETLEDIGLAQFLRERAIVPEKNDLNTILFLVPPGIEVSKAGTLVAALADFTRHFDANVPLRTVMPEFVAARPRVYGNERLRDLCQRMHDFYREGQTSQLQRLQFQAEHFPEIAMSPQEATWQFTANQIDHVPIDKVGGRVAATMALVYPPGIGIVVPGERWDERAAPMIAYLKLFGDSYAQFPGFANEIQGVYPEEGEDGRVRLFSYVLKE